MKCFFSMILIILLVIIALNMVNATEQFSFPNSKLTTYTTNEDTTDACNYYFTYGYCPGGYYVKPDWTFVEKTLHPDVCPCTKSVYKKKNTFPTIIQPQYGKSNTYLDKSVVKTVTTLPTPTQKPIVKPTNSVPKTSTSPSKNTTITSTVEGSDLIITDCIVRSENSGREISFDLVIKNKGSVATGKFNIAYFLSKDKTETPFIDINKKEFKIGYDDVERLEENESKPAKSSKKISITSDIPKGSYWFGIYVDSGNCIAESDESNNVKYWNEEILVN